MRNTDTQSSRSRPRIAHYDLAFAGLQHKAPGLRLAAFRGRRNHNQAHASLHTMSFKRASQQMLGWPPRRLGHGYPWGIPSLIDQTSGGEPPDRTSSQKHDDTSCYVVDWRVTVKGF